MADLDITTRLIYEAQGQEAINQASLTLERNRNAIENTQIALKYAGDAQGAYKERLADLARANVQLTQDLERLQAAESAHVRVLYEETTAEMKLAASVQQVATATRTVSTGMGALQQSSGKAGMAMLQMGYFADDLQYGLRGVVNNIPGLVASLGVGAGVAGVAAIAAVAISQLANHWNQLASLFGASTTQTEAERMDALAKATARTVDETVKLAQYKREEAAAEEILTGLPKAQREQATRVKEAIEEAGGPALVKGFAQLQIEQAGGLGALSQRAEAERRERERARGAVETFTSAEQWTNQWQTIKRNLGVETKQQQVAGLAKGIQIDYETYAKRDLARAETDTAWRAKMIGVIQAHPEFFPAGSAEKLMAAAADPAIAKKKAIEDAKVQAEAQKAYKFAASDLIRQGVFDKDDPSLRAFQAGQLPLAGLGARALRIRAAAEANVQRAAAAEGDPKAHKILEDQLRIMRADKFQPIPPRPVAGARRP